MTPVTSPELPDRQDMVRAWACAINLQLYDADPGPRVVELAGGLETRKVDRREALIDLYSRDLLSGLAGDPAALKPLRPNANGEPESTLRSPHLSASRYAASNRSGGCIHGARALRRARSKIDGSARRRGSLLQNWRHVRGVACRKPMPKLR